MCPRLGPSKSQITAVTVYQGQALVTREVSVPEGDGTIELVVTPLPAQTVDNSLYTEGTDGLRVLSTRFRTRAVKEDTREEVRAKQEQLKTLKPTLSGSRKRSPCKGRTSSTSRNSRDLLPRLTDLTKKGRLDSAAILTLSKFVMESRGAKTKTETDLRQQLQANTEATEFATRQLTELSAGSSRVERDAVIVVHKTRPQATFAARLPRRLGELVAAVSATWRQRRRQCPSSARVPRRLDPADWRVLVECQNHAFHCPPLAGRRTTRVLPLKVAVAGRVTPARSTGKMTDRSGLSPSWRSRSTCRSQTRHRLMMS